MRRQKAGAISGAKLVRAQRYVARLASAGMPFEIAAICVASFLKAEGFAISESNLQCVFE